ncbi:cytochrome P450 [Boeremia exigua]|uniref:cytochrome P450 n=1 Tax=Boeremia exigua TaxID=749465 RepID=UPI001E8DEB89|nr:cytochrome P450 [Boeremia exigua]KAH6633545.1 cytochrome P450 [Boeremia exigua]
MDRVHNVLLAAQYLLFLLVLKVSITAIYNIYFHPLSKYPGPKLAVASRSFWSLLVISGYQPQWIHKQHEIYGEVVRVGPDRLCYINPQAWKDIYGHRTGGRPENQKDRRFTETEVNGEDSVLSTPDVATHGRVRRLFANAFSERALKLQEPLIRKYVDQLIEAISRSTKENKDSGMDMVKLFNCCTFDIMADLTFGEPLGMLTESEYTPWVKKVFASIKIGAFFMLRNEYPLLKPIIEGLLPTSLRNKRKAHFEHSAERVDRRLAAGNPEGKADIWSLVLEKGKDLVSLGQMHANASLFMVAGTETTATMLSGLTYHLLKDTDKLKKVADEVRALSEEDLSLERLPQLPYLNACFEEALRVYPPVPIGLPRVTPKEGTEICGKWVPGNTRVTVTQWASNHSPLNFRDPDSFRPERWLPDSGYDTDNKGAMQPFSYGPRNCLGKNLAYHEMRIIFAKVMWNFDLELCQGSDGWPDQKAWNLWDKPQLLCKARSIR